MPSLDVRSPWSKSKGRSPKKLSEKSDRVPSLKITIELYQGYIKCSKNLEGVPKKLIQILNNISDDSNPKKDKILTTQVHFKFA